jgi:quinoprotein glucose dehydrogenase
MRRIAGLLALLPVTLPLLAATSEWRYYGGDPGGKRYVDAAGIDRTNVAALSIAWTYRTGDMGEGYPSRGGAAFEATPLLIDGVLYVSTPFGQIHAIDARTGERLWRHDAGTPKDRRYSENTSRGVSYWADPQRAAGHCARRIVFGTQDARLLALDAADGTRCEAFGDGGVVDLNAGSRPRHPGNYLITSPPAVYGDLLISGSAVGDNGAVDLELGIVRAIDARTGEVRWAFDPIPRNAPEIPEEDWLPEQAAKTGAANAWTVLSVDPERGLVFVPTGSASPDFYGGERLGANRHANSLVALDAASGDVVWARQLVHHDLWDYDLPAQPVLIDLEREGVRIPAVVQATKMGMVYVFDRRTGEPLFPIEERPVPASTVPGEVAWETQPFSTLPSLVPTGALTPDDAWGLTPVDRWHCRRQIERYRSEGIFTPPSLEGTILWPSYAGGANWGSVSYDPVRQYVIVNVIRVPAVVQLLPREEFDRQVADPDYPDSQYTAQLGTPYGMRRQLLESFLGVPCSAPPWGTLSALDLSDGRIAWEVPLGTSEDLAPWPFKGIRGMPNIGGSIVTSGGLVFIGAALDDYLRAFDVDTGEELWKGRLPAGGQATPMSYVLDGRQYVVIAAGGHGGAGTTRGDHLVAFALPYQRHSGGP